MAGHPYLVRQWRDLFRITQRDLAEEAGIHAVTLNRIERGKLDPTISTALKIVSALERLAPADAGEGLGLDSLFGGDAEWLLREKSDELLKRGWIAEPERLEAEPFREWLRKIKGRDGLRNADLARELGIPAQTLDAILRGRVRTVELALVDTALTHQGGTTVEELYRDA